jgi:hypothetical protein
MQPDTFGVYTRRELEHWGNEFALFRDVEYLGYASKNMLQVLVEHRGEMPPPNIGYKPFETDMRAQRIEDIVTDVARSNRPMACVLRAYYCGSGRRKVERWETANLLLANLGERPVSVRHYLSIHELGFQRVTGRLEGLSQAA